MHRINSAKKRKTLIFLSHRQIIRDNAVRQLKNEVDIQTICGHNSFIVKCIAFWQSHREIYLCKSTVAIVTSVILFPGSVWHSKIEQTLIESSNWRHFFSIVSNTVSEYISGGELFGYITKFSHKLVQLYVAEIALALGNLPFWLLCCGDSTRSSLLFFGSLDFHYAEIQVFNLEIDTEWQRNFISNFAPFFQTSYTTLA